MVDVAGSKRIRDVYDDAHIPIKQSSHSERDQALKQYLDTIPELYGRIGHSLRDSVILEAQSNDKMAKSFTQQHMASPL